MDISKEIPDASELGDHCFLANNNIDLSARIEDKQHLPRAIIIPCQGAELAHTSCFLEIGI